MPERHFLYAPRPDFVQVRKTTWPMTISETPPKHAALFYTLGRITRNSSSPWCLNRASRCSAKEHSRLLISKELSEAGCLLWLLLPGREDRLPCEKPPQGDSLCLRTRPKPSPRGRWTKKGPAETAGPWKFWERMPERPVPYGLLSRFTQLQNSHEPLILSDFLGMDSILLFFSDINR
jgi:hypothetical protein